MAHLADTNLLLRAAQDGHPQQADARDAIRTLVAAGEGVCLARQNLVEFWLVATRPAERNGLALTPEQAEAGPVGVLPRAARLLLRSSCFVL
jgi:predicted nucleic acid-binding protein